MNNSPENINPRETAKTENDESTENNKSAKKKPFSHLLDNNKFVFLLSLFVAFIIWVVVAMYASPEESYTVYNVPIVVDTENSIVSQRGYKNFWQSDETIDVTVTGPRYLVTSLTANDILVSANLNKVNAAGVSELDLRVSLREFSQDITVSSWTKSSVEVYFDAELTREFDIELDNSAIPEHIAEGYKLSNADLTVSKIKLIGPETEMNKIVRVVADIQYPEDLLFKSGNIPATLNLEGATAADTVSVNKYVSFVDEQEYFVNVAIDRIVELKPTVHFTGAASGKVKVSYNVENILVTADTLKDFNEDQLTVMSVNSSALKEGENVFSVKLSSLQLPSGVKFTDPNFTVIVTVTLEGSDG